MHVTAEIARMRFTNQLTSTGVATFPKAQVSGKSRTEVMKLIRPKLRMEPSRADGRFTKTPYSARQVVAMKAISNPRIATCPVLAPRLKPKDPNCAEQSE